MQKLKRNASIVSLYSVWKVWTLHNSC